MVPKPLQKLGGDSPLMSTGPTSPILAQYRQVVLWPLYVNSTTLCICLLLFPFRFCHSCHVSFCYMSLVFMLILHSMKGMGSQACTDFSHFLMGLDIVFVEVPIYLARWAFAPIASFLAVSMGVLAIILAMLAHWAHYLSFLGLPWPIYFIFLPLIMSMGLLAVIHAMLAHQINYLFPRASTTHLPYFYLLLCLQACWLSFLACWPIGLINFFLGFPRPIYFAFTSWCAFGPFGCPSCHVGPFG